MLLRHLFIFLLFTLGYASPSWSDELIIEPAAGRQPVLQAINHAHQSVALVMYGFTDDTLLRALLQQKKRGTTVNVILEEHPYLATDENQRTIHAFKQAHLPWQGSVPPLRLVHQKTLLIDGKQAMVMTFNFTHSTFKNERNFAIVIDDPMDIKEIAAVFSADWNHVAIHPQAANLIWSPDNSRQKFLALITGAKQSICIYAQQLSDYQIIGALAKAAKKGIAVQVITSNKLREKQAAYLNRAGVTIHTSQSLYIHAKAMLIDNQIAVIGSTNLTRASLEDNRELSVITRDVTVVKQLNNVFRQDWRETSSLSEYGRQVYKHRKQILRFVNTLIKYGVNHE